MKLCRSRLLRGAGFVLALLAPSLPARAFLEQLTVTTGDATFTFDITASPQWTLTTDSGASVYRGLALTSAKFGRTDAISFTDELDITLNDAPVNAKLTGKVGDCGDARIVLKDETNRRTITLGPGAENSCSSAE